MHTALQIQEKKMRKELEKQREQEEIQREENRLRMDQEQLQNMHDDVSGSTCTPLDYSQFKSGGTLLLEVLFLVSMMMKMDHQPLGVRYCC